MRKCLVIIIFSWMAVAAYPQKGDAHEQICLQQQARFVKKDYRQFKKTSCDFENYPDGKKEKECVCEATYYTSLGDYGTALEMLKQAYAKASSGKLKSAILQMTAENYRLAGDTLHARLYEEKIKIMQINNPDIDK